MKGLSKDTEKVFQNIKGLDIFKDYMLIGGTALSLQIHHRLHYKYSTIPVCLFLFLFYQLTLLQKT